MSMFSNLVSGQSLVPLLLVMKSIYVRVRSFPGINQARQLRVYMTARHHQQIGKILVTWCELIPVLYIAMNGVIWIPPFIRLAMPQEALSIWRLVYQFPKVIRSGTDCTSLVFNPQIDRTLYRGYTSNTLAMNLHNIVSLVSRSQCDTRAFLRIIFRHKAHNTQIRSQLLNSRYAGKKHNLWFDTNM